MSSVYEEFSTFPDMDLKGFLLSKEADFSVCWMSIICFSIPKFPDHQSSILVFLHPDPRSTSISKISDEVDLGLS